MLYKYNDFEEIISFLETGFKQFNTVYTFHTKNLFVYNIVFIKASNNRSIALVAGPILKFYPTDRSIERKLMTRGLPIYKKYEYIGILNNLPLASEQRIYQLGKLLLTLYNSDEKSWNSLGQISHGEMNLDELVPREELKDTKMLGYTSGEHDELYKLFTNLMDKIIHGNKNGIIDIIGEYKNLFWKTHSFSENNRSLYNVSIVICSVACHFAIQANVYAILLKSTPFLRHSMKKVHHFAPKS